MEKLTATAVTELIKAGQSGPVVTIYAPMHVTASPPHMTENEIRFKNLLHAALDELHKHPEGERLSKRLKEYTDQRLADIKFFECQSKGLLICAGEDGVREFKLPVDTEEYVAVDDQYHLAPVMGLLHDAVEYYVLTVAQQGPKLLKGDMYELVETDIELPESVAAGLNLDDAFSINEQQASARGSSTNTSWFNGRGGDRDSGEEERMRFFRMIDSIILEKADRKLPLVLAGIDAETVEYRNHSKYPRILQKTINGSHGGAKPSEMQELYEKSFQIVSEEVIEPRRQEAVEQFQRLQGQNPERTAGETEAVGSAAEAGRVDTLLLRMSRMTHDTIRDTSDAVSRITFPDQPISKELNKLAFKVVSMSGQVVNLDDAHMPVDTPAVATLRY